jgi:hypothetical protein
MASLIVDNPDSAPKTPATDDPNAALVTWVMGRVDRWRAARDSNFKQRWDEYYRMWRGRWNKEDKNRDSERSRLIAPALAQAIEMTVAEMEEATFGREQWFDVVDDDLENKDALKSRDQLLTDFALCGVPDKIAEAYLNGALYGNGIAKIMVEKGYEKIYNGQGGVMDKARAYVKVEAIPADEFIPDPAGRTIDEMLGCAHELMKPRHFIDTQKSLGVFYKSAMAGGMRDTDNRSAARSDLEQPLTADDAVLITEYHGLVPAKLLPTAQKKTAMDAVLEQGIEGDGPMVESIVTIANKGILLRAVANPFLMKDRSIISYQHDKVPGRFWGRGVSEKGYNPQKALDAELRTRIDALALIANPMMGADLTRLPRGFDLRVRPGKVWGTNGAPKDILQPIAFAGLEPNTFNQSGDMERMVQMGTGAMDTATPTSQNARNETATGSSLMVGAFIKRSKRAMNNVSRNFLEPLVRKALWRYMQFEPQLYPADYVFRVVATNGIMAREFEQNQLTQLMGQVPDTMMAPKMLLLQAIVDQSSSTVKGQLKDAIAAALKPDPAQAAQQQMIQQLQVKALQLDIENKQITNDKLHADGLLVLAKTKTEAVKADIADDQVTVDASRVVLQHQNIPIQQEQNRIAAEGNRIKIAQMGLDHHHKMAALNKPKGTK